MAATTNLGVYKTILDSPSPDSVLDSAKMGGKLRCKFDYHLSAVQIDTGSTIELPSLQKGDVPIGLLVATAGVGAATTLEVGDGTTADALIATGGITDLNSASVQVKLFKAGIFGVALTAEKRIVVTTEAAHYAAAKTIYFGVLYVDRN